MHILLMYPGGRQQEALLLAGTRERMRVMMPGQADAMEFRLIEGAWMGESGAAVEIAAMVAQAVPPADQLRVAHIEASPAYAGGSN